MSNLKEVRNRIQSIKSTRQITSAMKMVAASKLHKVQQTILNIRHYGALLRNVLDNLIRQGGIAKLHPLAIDHGAKKVLIISIGSNKGLCGTYNTMVLKKTLSQIQSSKKQQLDVELLLIGKKNEAFFNKNKYEIHSTHHEVLDKLTFAQANNLANDFMKKCIDGDFDRVDVVYNRFKNAVVQELVVEQLLPVPTEALASGIHDQGPHHIEDGDSELYDSEKPMMADTVENILEPSPKEVMDYMLPHYISTNLYRILLDASASEHGARMTSMHKATDNADDLLRTLTLEYNKARQSMITREIMEIVSGAEVLNQ